MRTGARRSELQETERVIEVGRLACLADPAGALYVEEERMLLIADLHLEKASSFAARGQFLPPYDTAVTLANLTRLVARYAPTTVIALGDSFHDDGGMRRLDADNRALVRALQAGRTFIWIAGNHDTGAAAALSDGEVVDEVRVSGVALRHEPSASETGPEIAGHLHPAAKLRLRGCTVRRRCFATDGRRLVMPAFGAYAGGLNLLDKAFAPLFPAGATAHMLGTDRVYAVSRALLLPD